MIMPSIQQLTTLLYRGVCAPILTIMFARLFLYFPYAVAKASEMFEQAIKRLAELIGSPAWVAEVAGILPLSALIDFVDVPQKLHIHQLVSAVPHWSWPVTPAGSRLLLEDAPTGTQQVCVLDRFGRSTGLEGLDGAFGVRYFVMNPETIRLIMDSLSATSIENNHDNMYKMKKSDMRVQNLQVLFVSRNPPSPASTNNNNNTGSGLWRLFSSWKATHSSLSYQLTSLLGWVILLGLVAAAGIFRLYLAAVFLVLMPITGLCVSRLYPGSPRKLLKSPRPNEPMRMVVVTEHMNSADWIAFYGPSTVINSLLNTPLEPSSDTTTPSASSSTITTHFLLRTLLRVLVLGQWALAIGASATKDWNSFFISFWVLFCNVTHGYVIPPSKQAGAWASAQGCANLSITKCSATVSTRRALLSTLVALNPESFKEVAPEEEGQAEFPKGTTRWIDPILPTGASRTEWEKAMRKALKQLAPGGWDKDGFEALEHVLEPEMEKKLCKVEVEEKAIGAPQGPDVVKNLPALSEGWNEEYMDKSFYWKRFVPEGIYMAAKIREKGRVQGDKVGFGGSVV